MKNPFKKKKPKPSAWEKRLRKAAEQRGYIEKKRQEKKSIQPDQKQEINNKKENTPSDTATEEKPIQQPMQQVKEKPVHKVPQGSNYFSEKRSIRVFVSSTFRDMMEERDALMTHAWPQLRSFCRDRHVELVEVDLRWGISEEQSERNETLKLCLDEIRACRPFFICLLGERYGWVPGDDAFTADIKEEQPWLKDLMGKSVTELEILHGVLNNPEMAGRAFFYFRDPAYAREHGIDFLPENDEAARKQIALKNHIRTTCKEKNIPLHENYSDSASLAALVLEELKNTIETQFPKEITPDPLTIEAHDHEAFAEIRRRTYIGRPEYFEILDNYVKEEGSPLVLVGESGSGKSALLANWVDRWQKAHPQDFIFQHYIGGTPDSSIHWKLMARLMAEIKDWSDDPNKLPRSKDDILRDFPLWLSKARSKAQHDRINFIVVLDALNQLEDKDHGRLLGWLPGSLFAGALRLIVSTLPGDTLEILEKNQWSVLSIQQLTMDERKTMIIEYLTRFGKKLDGPRLNRIVDSEVTSNPLYLKILLDELRVTGTHEKLDERLDDYIAAADIPTLLGKILARYQRDYEHDRKGLVKDALGLIWASRRGLTEMELLQLLSPKYLPQLPLAKWAPLRAAMEENLVDRGGILNFSHDFLRTAVIRSFLSDQDTKDKFRIVLADYFELQPITYRNGDELPWLLWKTELCERLRKCLLDIDCFLEIRKRDKDELHDYWIYMKEERSMGKYYLDSFNDWYVQKEASLERISYAANELGLYLKQSALYDEASLLMNRAIETFEKSLDDDHPDLATILNNKAQLLYATNRLEEAELLMRKVLKIDEKYLGKNHPNVARDLNNLGSLLKAKSCLSEAEMLMRRAIKIDEECLGEDHPDVARDINNLALLLQIINRHGEAESLMIRALKIDEKCFGKDHPNVAIRLSNLAYLYSEMVRMEEAELLLRRALKIDEEHLGKDHPILAKIISNLAHLLKATNRVSEAESLYLRALKINENNFGNDHSAVATDLNNLANLYHNTNRMSEAEPLYLEALKIDERSFGKSHPTVAVDLNNLAELYRITDRLSEAEPLYLKALKIDEEIFGEDHPNVARDLNNLAELYRLSNKMKKAEPLYLRAIKINESVLGKNHPDLAKILNNLSEVYRVTKRISEAEPLIRRAIKINEERLGNNHPDLAINLNNLALILQEINRFDEAEPLSRQMVEIFINVTRTTGREHPQLETAKYNYIELLLAMGWSKRKIRKQLRKIAPEFLNKSNK